MKMNQQFLIWAITIAAIILIFVLLFAGCSSPSSVKMVTDPNNGQAITATGDAADIIAKELAPVLAANKQTEEGRLNKLLAMSNVVFGFCAMVFVAGIPIAIFLPSKWRHCVWISGVAGMVVIYAFNKYADIAALIALGLLILAVVLMAWKWIQNSKEKHKLINGNERVKK